jgi:prepilin-type N-terminal cleavage/methylation domain-containing protein
MKNNNGFTLVELTVVLIVGGLIMAGAAHAFYLWLVQHKMDVTRERMAVIQTAVTKYVQENGNLPCPAPIDAAYGNDRYGRATDCSTGAGAEGTVRYVRADGRTTRIGAVPIYALDLPDLYLGDAYGYRFTYAVAETLGRENLPLFDPTLGSIYIKDGNDQDMITPAGSALYTLVSHGMNGRGAYVTDSGVQSSQCQGQGRELVNCTHNDGTFVHTQQSRADGSGYFDDFVAYATDIEGSTVSNMERCDEKGMQYAPNDPGADPEGCIFAPSLADLNCPAGEAITGFSGGVPQCAAVGGGGGSEPPSSCPPGQVWNGSACEPETPQCNCTPASVSGIYAELGPQLGGSTTCGAMASVVPAQCSGVFLFQCRPEGWQYISGAFIGCP